MVEIKEYLQYREEEILPLYAAVGWTAYTERPEALRRGFERSLLKLAAYEDDTCRESCARSGTVRLSCLCRIFWSIRHSNVRVLDRRSCGNF